MAGHVPVLLKETIEGLAIKDGGTYVDCTLGRAGHSSEILRRIPNGLLIGIDRDDEALMESSGRLERIGENFTLVRSNFASLSDLLRDRGIEKVDGILADLGVSSPQFDEAERGFSYRLDAPLDMRMDRRQSLTAKVVVNTYSLAELTRVFRDYGEEKEAYAIAKAIVREREKAPIETTFELVEVIKKALPPKRLSQKGHPAKQVFQALRIEVNGEEDELLALLEQAPSLLKKDGRLAIITFMSLDDRLVKRKFASLTTIEGSRHGIELPSQIKEPEFVLFTKKPILPSEEELEENHRSASAKLRILIKK